MGTCLTETKSWSQLPPPLERHHSAQLVLLQGDHNDDSDDDDVVDDDGDDGDDGVDDDGHHSAQLVVLQDDHNDDVDDDDGNDDNDGGDIAIMVIGSDDWDTPPKARSSNQSFGSSPRETPPRGGRNKMLDAANLVISIYSSFWKIFFLTCRVRCHCQYVCSDWSDT